MNPDQHSHQAQNWSSEEELLKVRQTFLDNLSIVDLNPKWAAPIDTTRKKKKPAVKSSGNRAKK